MLRKRLTHGRLCYELVELTLNKKRIAISQSLFYFLFYTQQNNTMSCAVNILKNIAKG